MAKIAYDGILDALKTIAGKLGATLPTKKYSNQKDAIAGTLDAISDADIGGGGSGGGVTTYEFTADVENTRYIGTVKFTDVLAAFAAGNLIYFYMPESSLSAETYLLIDGICYNGYENPPYILGYNTNVNTAISFGATEEGYIYISIYID